MLGMVLWSSGRIVYTLTTTVFFPLLLLLFLFVLLFLSLWEYQRYQIMAILLLYDIILTTSETILLQLKVILQFMNLEGVTLFTEH